MHIPNTHKTDRQNGGGPLSLSGNSAFNKLSEFCITETQLSPTQEWIEMYYLSACGEAGCGNDIKI